MRERVSMVLIASALVGSTTLAWALGGAMGTAPYQQRTGPIATTPIADDTIRLCGGASDFDYRRARPHFANAERLFDVHMRGMFDRYSGVDPSRMHAASKGRPDARSEMAGAIEADLEQAAFLLDALIPRLAVADDLPDLAEQLQDGRFEGVYSDDGVERLQIALVRTMLKLSAGSGGAVSALIERTGELQMSALMEGHRDLAELIEAVRGLQRSYPSFQTALSQTIAHSDFERTMYDEIARICKAPPPKQEDVDIPCGD